MPLMTQGNCWRGRDDCESFSSIEGGIPEDATEEQLATLDYKPASFVCCGCITKDKDLAQDAYRLCFKNDVSDEMSDNDVQDLTHVAAVISHALAILATRRVNGGMVEVPTMQADMPDRAPAAL